LIFLARALLSGMTRILAERQSTPVVAGDLKSTQAGMAESAGVRDLASTAGLLQWQTRWSRIEELLHPSVLLPAQQNRFPCAPFSFIPSSVKS
jgi:hypothetical protein